MSIPTVLVFPFPAQGHVNSCMSFSQKLVEQGCKIIFVNTEFNHKRVLSSIVDNDQDTLNGSEIRLVSIPDGLGPEHDRNDWGELLVAMIRTMPAMLEKLIEDIHLNLKGEDRIRFIVADATVAWALEIASKMGISAALLWTAAAATFALQYHIPTLIDDGIIDSDGFPTTKRTFQISPSMPVMDTGDIFWSNLHDSVLQKKSFNYLVQYCIRYLNLTDWWFCNTTYELEPGPLSFLPKLLPVGPLLERYDINTSQRSLGQFWKEDFSCLNWLDQQPPCSVLYVASGSTTLLDQDQFNELAIGLELTHRPFLWVVREDPISNFTHKNELVGSNRGKIVGWAPQQRVLSHPAIACFVSHCGWNSTMEGLSNGVPFLCWPYFADQLYDKKFICNELKVGLGFDSDENGLVSREEIKRKVDQLLSNDQIRARSLKLKEMLMNNVAEGGGSSENFNRFVKWLKD